MKFKNHLMIRFFSIIFFIFSIVYFGQAQVNPNALGLRFGGNGDINGAELSYQHGLGGTNRLELDLGFSGNSEQNRLFLAGIYHWHWTINGGLNWYVGPGASLGFYSIDNSDDHFNIGIGGQIGLEYDFNQLNTPILLSIDARPIWDLIGNSSGFGWGLALGLRYTW